MFDTPTNPDDSAPRSRADEADDDDPRLEDPTIDAPWKDLGPREDLSEQEKTERAARLNPHGGS